MGESWEEAEGGSVGEGDAGGGVNEVSGSPDVLREDPGMVGGGPQEEARRPTPVRKAMEGSDPEGGDGAAQRRILRVPESGEEWAVAVTGRSCAGIPPLKTVALMELSFTPARDPDAPPRRVLRQESALADLPDEELLALLFPSPGNRDPSRKGDTGMR